MERVASFCGFQNPTQISVLKFSQCGFYLIDRDFIQCSECKAQVRVEQITSPPSDKKYHVSAKCTFAQTGLEDAGSACSYDHLQFGSIDDEGDGEFQDDGCDFSASSTTRSTLMSGRADGLETEENLSTILSDINSRNGPKEEIDSGVLSLEESDQIDEPIYRYEAFYNPKKEEWKDVKGDKKEDTSEKMVALSKTGKENFPQELQSEESIAFTKCTAKAAVKIVVSHSDNSVDCDAITGSGSLYLDCQDFTEHWIEKLRYCNELTKKQIEILKGFKSNSAKKKDYYFSVLTSSHIVRDQKDAMAARVECFYDLEDKRDVVVVQGFAVKHSKVKGDYRSYLICRTSTLGLIYQIQQIKANIEDMASKLPLQIKEALSSSCFLVAHPDGKEKMISFGKCRVVKYLLRTDKIQGKTAMVYCKDKDSLSISSDVREVLLYNAPTRPGSSGSPVFTFRRMKNKKTGDDFYQLYVWIHNGKERTTELGGSVMKPINQDLSDNIDPLPLEVVKKQLSNLGRQQQPPQDSTSGGDCGKKRRRIPPLYENYFTWNARLASYQDGSYVSKCDHTPEELSLGGFFYTGDGDCVRCFYCGLGLKVWRHGDNMYTEHQKARPNCGFLKLCLAWTKSLKPQLELVVKEKGVVEHLPAATGENSGLSTGRVISLLNSEIRIRKQQQQCKMCFRRPAQELFLPCGEILTCTGCAGILATCPSCCTKVAATVTIFLA